MQARHNLANMLTAIMESGSSELNDVIEHYLTFGEANNE